MEEVRGSNPFRSTNTIGLDALPSIEIFGDQNIRTALFRFTPEPDSGFADYLQFAIDGGNGHGIQAEGLEIHPNVNCSIITIASTMSLMQP